MEVATGQTQWDRPANGFAPPPPQHYPGAVNSQPAIYPGAVNAQPALYPAIQAPAYPGFLFLLCLFLFFIATKVYNLQCNNNNTILQLQLVSE